MTDIELVLLNELLTISKRKIKTRVTVVVGTIEHAAISV